jgi:membrane protein YqaA with SNARE-associated domain
MPEETPITQPFSVSFSTEEASATRPLRWIFGTVAVIVIFAASIYLVDNPELVLRLGRWGYLGAFLISLIASATIILPAPGIAVIIAMGAALDPILLGIVAGIGSAVGELSGYLAGRGGRAFIPHHPRSQFEQLQRLTDRYGAALLILLSAIPFPLFDFAGIIAGMMKMRVATFIATVSLGKSAKYVFMILVGTGPLLLLNEFLQNLSNGY